MTEWSQNCNKIPKTAKSLEPRGEEFSAIVIIPMDIHYSENKSR